MIFRKIITLRQVTLNRISILKDRLKLPEKWKGGRIEKWSYFWQGLVMDYKGVATDVIEGAKSRPYKAVAVGSGLCLLSFAIKTNPDENSFDDNLLNCISTLTMVGDMIRNPTSEQHIQYMTRCQNQGLLRLTDLIFLSLVWEADYSKDCNIYAAQCKYLKPKYTTFHQRILDVGAFGIWWNMRQKMNDFDINPSEWDEQT